MTNVDAPSTVRKWVSDWSPQWKLLSIRTELRLPEEAGLNKVVTTLESPTHAASVTAWGSGTLEFIVLDLAKQSEVIMSDKEYGTAEELRCLLDRCAASFNELLGSSLR